MVPTKKKDMVKTYEYDVAFHVIRSLSALKYIHIPADDQVKQ